MNSETFSTEIHSQRAVLRPLKQKRRFKADEEVQEHEAVLINANVELRRHRERMTRSGRPTVQWRRVTPPTELSELMPSRARTPILARVIDKVKAPRVPTSNHQGIWSLLRCWAFAWR